jgi:beta-fructofuranosidase
MARSGISRRRFLRGIGVAAGVSAAYPRKFWGLPDVDHSLRERLALDILRPQYHLLPTANWMNDPNGPIYYQGQYHVFYQYNPHGAFWGTMHWGHAVSENMVHWKHLPIALAPTPGGPDWDGCFTGSAVLDNGVPTMIYTGVTPEVQCLATSQDGLRTWKKDPKPVIAGPPPGMRVTGFRDPCPWREGDEWYLGIGSGIPKKGGVVLLYRSKDLRQWAYLHTLAEGTWNGRATKDPVDSGEMWECPDFFALGGKHVLLYSTERIVYWVVGSYADHRFHEEKRGVLDYGSYYAPKSMVDARGDRILWGWTPETRSVDEQKAAGWSGSMTLPRRLSLGNDGSLEMEPIAGVARLKSNPQTVPATLYPESYSARVAALRVRNLAGYLEVKANKADCAFSVTLQEEGSAVPFASIAFDPAKSGHELSVNNISAPLPLNAESPEIHAYLDGSVLEVYANRRICVTARIYARAEKALRIVLDNDSISKNLLKLTVADMQSISRDRLTS